jgi:hypothetical protein
METVLPWLHQKTPFKSVYLIGNDYVWPKTTNTHAKRIVGKLGAKIVGEEYVPLA